MRILADLSTKIIECKCQCLFEYDSSDIYIGAFGCAYVKCPICGKEHLLDGEGIELTKDNLTFPQHFWHTSISTGAVSIDNNKVQVMIDELLSKRIPEDEWIPSMCTSHGDTFVCLFKYRDEDSVIVTKDYYEVDIERKDD